MIFIYLQRDGVGAIDTGGGHTPNSNMTSMPSFLRNLGRKDVCDVGRKDVGHTDVVGRKDVVGRTDVGHTDVVGHKDVVGRKDVGHTDVVGRKDVGRKDVCDDDIFTIPEEAQDGVGALTATSLQQHNEHHPPLRGQARVKRWWQRQLSSCGDSGGGGV